MAMIHGIGTSRPPAAQMPPRAEDLRQREGTLPGLLTLRGDATNWLALQNEQYGSVIGAWHFSNVNGDRLKLEYVPTGGSAYSGLTFWNNGKVSIGNDVDIATDYEYALYVWKGILTDKVKVAVLNEDQWEDRVFKPGYELKSLPEVKTFIAEYGHLPGVPSACEMVDQGLDVLQTDAMLLKKIEELTLHAIRLEERVKELERAATKGSKP
jgi:hypothetical protein